MEKQNIQRMPENLTIKVLKAWETLSEELRGKRLSKNSYKSWISRNIKYYLDSYKRHKLKKSVYNLYDLNSYEKAKVSSLMNVYGGEDALYWAA